MEISRATPIRQALLRSRPREPFNGYSHLTGALLSVLGLVVLTAISVGKPWHSVAFAVYGTTLILMYTASTLYHSLPAGPREVEKLLMVDQVSIYLLIAGTYTPICLVALRDSVGLPLLAVVWTIAIAGIVLRTRCPSAPRWLPIAIYLAMGWLCVTVLGPLSASVPAAGLGWLIAGGAAYTVGAVVLVADRPRLRPGIFGSHELWHCFVLAGSACHFLMMLLVVATMR